MKRKFLMLLRVPVAALTLGFMAGWAGQAQAVTLACSYSSPNITCSVSEGPPTTTVFLNIDLSAHFFGINGIGTTVTDAEGSGTFPLFDVDTYLADRGLSLDEVIIRTTNMAGEVQDLVTVSLAAMPSDADADGVLDGDDNCPNTVIPESLPTTSLRVNRYALVDGDTVFDTTSSEGRGPLRSYTTADTRGCSCTQIIEALGLGSGNVKFGCSISAMDDWTGLVN